MIMENIGEIVMGVAFLVVCAAAFISFDKDDADDGEFL
jgi:hypothetical protein